MRLLDSNIIIYATKPGYEFLHPVISAPVLDAAVALRRQRRMTLGDSLVAASALIHNCTVVNRNASDFAWISNLITDNPFATRGQP